MKFIEMCRWRKILPQANYPCSNFSDTSCLKLLKLKGWLSYLLYFPSYHIETAKHGFNIPSFRALELFFKKEWNSFVEGAIKYVAPDEKFALSRTWHV